MRSADANRTVATATRSLRTSTLRRIHKDAWGYFGQRVRYFLPQVLAPARPERVDQPVHMLLDNAKMPATSSPRPPALGRRARLLRRGVRFEGKGAPLSLI